MKKTFLISLLLIVSATSVFAQKILTANDFFKMVSENYGKIKDYEANITMTVQDSKMEGKASFKRPNLLRIDFSNPESQVIVFTGDILTIYLPALKAVLTQTVEESNSSGANLATPQGLQLMSRYYSISYLTGPDPVNLDEEDNEQVIKLELARRNFSEGFRTIQLSINPETLLIRRVDALSISDERFVMDFLNYAINVDIPDTRFIYNAPSSANNYDNFLFSE